jgi:3-dehydroquinate dehydratase-2
MARTIFVLNGANLNLLGTREPAIYGRATLADTEALCRKTAARHGLEIDFRQTNHEGTLVDWVQEAGQKAVGIVLNPAGHTTTSVSLHDAILSVRIPVVEVHISNIFARESFRHPSMISPVAKGVICGFGIEGYGLAIAALAAVIGAASEA